MTFSTDSAYLASAVMSLGFAGRYVKDTGDARHLHSLLNAEYPRIVQIAAALALGTLLASDLPARAMDLLIDFTGEDTGVIATYTTSLHLRSSLLGYAWQMLHFLGL
jgi:hypothetical protein